MIADDLEVKPYRQACFIAAREILEGQFQTAVIPQGKFILEVVNSGQTIAVHTFPHLRKVYPLFDIRATFHLVATIQHVKGDEFIAKNIIFPGVISDQRMRGAHNAREADGRFHIASRRLDYMMAFGQWLRDKGNDAA